MPRWGLMWTIAVALYAGCKWLTYDAVRLQAATVSGPRRLGYLLAWPGMDPRGFLFERSTNGIARPTVFEWISAGLKTLFGATLTWIVARTALPSHPFLAGWIGMVGLIFVVHFGTFHLLALVWRHLGVNAELIMRNPARSTSLAEFWGRRWNTAFHELAARFTFRPLRRVVGLANATLIVFLISGLIHELVITVPARGGYGLPTAYFALQGLGIVGERTPLAHRLGLGSGWRGWIFTALVTAGPAYWLFPPLFIRNVVLPMLAAIGAASGAL